VVSLMGSMLSEAQEELILKAAGPAGKSSCSSTRTPPDAKGRSEASRDCPLAQRQPRPVRKEGTQPEDLTAEELAVLLGRAA